MLFFGYGPHISANTGPTYLCMVNLFSEEIILNSKDYFYSIFSVIFAKWDLREGAF